MQPVKIDGGTQFCTLCEYCILSVIVLGMYATRVMFFLMYFWIISVKFVRCRTCWES